MRWLMLFLLAYLTTAAGSCSARTASTESAETSIALSTLPAPTALLRHAQTDDQLQRMPATQFNEHWPNQNLLVGAETVRFQPLGGGLKEAAFAIYEFVLPEYDDDPNIYFDWVFPPEGGKLSIGLSHWASGRWEWYTPTEYGRLQLTDASQYIRTQENYEGQCLVCIMLSGTEAAELNWMSFGAVDGIEHPSLESVMPLAGAEGSLLQLSSDAKGADLIYAWDFGAAALPATSTAAQPQVLLQAAGVYSASLTISNGLGSARHDFELRVLPEGYWVRTIGTAQGETVRRIEADAQGDIYALVSAGHTAAGPGPQTRLAKLSMDGSVQWYKAYEFEGPNTPVAMRCMADGTIRVASLHLEDEIFLDTDFVYALTLDATGQLLDAQQIELADQALSDAELAADGAILCTGAKGALARIAVDGSTAWAYDVGGTCCFQELALTEVGDIWACGGNSSNGLSIVRTDGTGTLQMARSADPAWTAPYCVSSRAIPGGLAILISLTPNLAFPQDGSYNPPSHLCVINWDGTARFCTGIGLVAPGSDVTVAGGDFYVTHWAHDNEGLSRVGLLRLGLTGGLKSSSVLTRGFPLYSGGALATDPGGALLLGSTGPNNWVGLEPSAEDVYPLAVTFVEFTPNSMPVTPLVDAAVCTPTELSYTLDTGASTGDALLMRIPLSP